MPTPLVRYDAVWRLRGTFAPFFRASDRPMAIACSLLFTRVRARPLLSVPRLYRRMALCTARCAALPYRRFGMVLHLLSVFTIPLFAHCGYSVALLNSASGL